MSEERFLLALDKLIHRTHQDLMYEQARPVRTFRRLAGQRAHELTIRLKVLEEVRKLYLETKQPNG